MNTEATHISIDELLAETVARNASDLHLTVGSPPIVRVRGELEPLVQFPKLNPAMTRMILYGIMSTEQQKQLEITRQIDMSHAVPGLARFRVNIYFQRRSVGAR